MDRKVEKENEEKEAKEYINKSVVLVDGNSICSPKVYWTCVSAWK